MRRWRWLAVICSMSFVAGCGGGSGEGGAESSTTERAVLTPAAVKRCLEEGAVEMRLAPPLAPKGSPLNTPAFYAIGPERGAVGVILSPNRAISRRIAAILNRRHEFVPQITRNGKAIMLLEPSSVSGLEQNRALVEECAEG